jgi:hypothetical protein
VVWNQRLIFALLLTRTNSYISPSTRPREASLDTRIDRDNQVAAAILSTTSESILSAHIDLLSCSKVAARRSRMVFNSLEKLYGTSGPQYSFALGRKFIEKRCGDEEDVEAWVNQVQAQYRELKHQLVRSRCSLHVFSSMVWLTASHRSWTRSGRLGRTPRIDDVKISILRVNNGQLNRSNHKALAARAAPLSLDMSMPSLNAFYAAFKQSGKKPSKEHACARCGPPYHWVVGCSNPADPNENLTQKRWKEKKGKGERSNETAAPAQATETAAFVSDVITSSDHTSVEQVLTSDYSHLSFTASSNRWIIDSGASEHMAGDQSLLFDMVALASVTRITTAGNSSVEAPSTGSISLVNSKKEVVTLTQVLCVRGLGFNLISVPRLTRLGADVRFQGSLCRLLVNDIEVLRAELQDKAYIVEATQRPSDSLTLNKCRSPSVLRSRSQPSERSPASLHQA